MKRHKVMIIGGTSGIGLALAHHYLDAGADVAICGRNPERVDPQFVVRYPLLRLISVNIVDREAVRRATVSFAGDGLDLLIVTAGFYADTKTLERIPDAGMQMLRTNVLGVTYAFEAASEIMCERGHGHLVALASIAGLLREYPGRSLYSSTKCAVIALCDVYRKALAPHGITVSAIIPGYVDTARLRELNEGNAREKPFLCSEADAVMQITRAIERRLARHVFPWQLHWLIRVFNLMPAPLRQLRKK
jgi:NAD(P)-dependent dehydrogenase (short-subunit alcohol dehydrogenase family)